MLSESSMFAESQPTTIAMIHNAYGTEVFRLFLSAKVMMALTKEWTYAFFSQALKNTNKGIKARHISKKRKNDDVLVEVFVGNDLIDDSFPLLVLIIFISDDSNTSA